MFAKEANTYQSKKHDKSLKCVALLVFKDLQKDYPKLKHEVKNYGIAPDGGIFYYKDIPICSSEAKSQGPLGNAHERWFKNHYMLKTVNNSIAYVTFLRGAGAAPKGTILTEYYSKDGKHSPKVKTKAYNDLFFPVQVDQGEEEAQVNKVFATGCSLFVKHFSGPTKESDEVFFTEEEMYTPIKSAVLKQIELVDRGFYVTTKPSIL